MRIAYFRTEKIILVPLTNSEYIYLPPLNIKPGLTKIHLGRGSKHRWIYVFEK